MIGGIIGVVIGFLGHYTKRPIERRFGNGWSSLCKYSVGVGLLYFPFVLFQLWLGMTKEEFKRSTVSFWLAALSVGAGVGLGYTFEK
jgi:hypothetical protein